MVEEVGEGGSWHDREYVEAWAADDTLGSTLELPRRLAAAVISLEASAPRVIMDVGSGPGSFLRLMLETFPGTRGIWVDSSEAMLAKAQETLGDFGSRVTYQIADMGDVRDIAPAGSVDVVTNARVAHHLGPLGLGDFYRSATELLAPGGWMVTLDHVAPHPVWDRRFRELLPSFVGPTAGKATHRHPLPYPTISDHLEAMKSVGLGDCDTIWRMCFTCLVMGRKSEESAEDRG